MAGKSKQEQEIAKLIGTFGGKGYGALNAVQKLVKIGEPAIPALVEALGNEEFMVRFFAGEALRTIGEPAIPALVEAMGGKPSFRSVEASHILAFDIGKAAVPALIEALGSKDSRMAYNAAYALAVIGDASAVPALLTKLDIEENLGLSANVAFALGEIGDPRAAEPLLRELEKAEDIIKLFENYGFAPQMEVARALGKLKDKRALKPALELALHGQDAQCRAVGIELLGYLGGKKAKEALEELKHDAEIGKNAQKALDRIGQRTTLPDTIPTPVKRAPKGKKKAVL